MSSEVSKMVQLICDEKGIDYDIVIEALETALGAAYRKDFGDKIQNIKFKYDLETGDMQAWDIKEVVADVTEDELEAASKTLIARREAAAAEERALKEEEVADLPRFNPKTELMLADAKKVKKTAKIGKVLEIELEIPGDFGRMAAQTAKQVIVQKLREAERDVVFEDFNEQVGQVIQGVVNRKDRSGNVIVDLGKINGFLPAREQSKRDMYRPGTRMSFLLKEVGEGKRGPEIILSRASKEMIESVFMQEIPEVESGEVMIKGIAREAGARSKVAVATDDDSIDPVGACIGQRGSRIGTIIDWLGGEKIDIVIWEENVTDYIKNSLSPAKVDSVELNEESKEATVNVPEDQYSLAIGRGGQNVRLASELTGWILNIEHDGSAEEAAAETDGEEKSIEEIEADTGADVAEAVTDEGQIPADAPEETLESEEGVVVDAAEEGSEVEAMVEEVEEASTEDAPEAEAEPKAKKEPKEKPAKEAKE
jgi:N utilization substance protein A